MVRSLVISLRVYKTNDKWDWTSLLGGEKKILLQKLPDHFEKILAADKVDKTRKLWIVSSANLFKQNVKSFWMAKN